MARRQRPNLGVRTVVAASASEFFVSESDAQSGKSDYASAFKQLDAFVEQYTREMNSPGMTLAMTD
jgi:hypothetical protein